MPAGMKCLIIKLGALGDVVMSTALVEAIRRHHDAVDSLVVLTTPAFAPLFERFDGLSVVAFERRGVAAMLRVVRFLRRERFDRIYDLQGNDRTQAWCALSGARERVGNHSRYPYTHHPDTPWRGQSHIFTRLCAVLASAGIDDVDARPRLPCGERERGQVDAWLDSHGLSPGAFVLLHAGASAARPDKRWPHFAALAERLAAARLAVVWIGAAPDADTNRALAAVTGIDATAAFDVPALAELGRRARFAVTNDSGPMHVLSAAGLPVFGLFGPSDWRRNHAVGQAERALACVELVPDYHGRRTGDCLAAIGVDTVLARLAAEGLLAGG